MKIAIISSVIGNLPVMKQCLSTWFPLPDNWEVYIYKSKCTYIDGTSDYLDSLKNERGVHIIEDGEHRRHNEAIRILLDEVKKNKFDWMLHLDSDVELLDKKFYSWANEAILKEKYTVWGNNHIRASSKIDAEKKILYLGRAHSWLIFTNIEFLIKNDLNFDDFNVEGHITSRTVPQTFSDPNQMLNTGDKIRIFGDIGWQIYTDAARFKLYQNLPDEICKMWSHKSNKSSKWFRENREQIEKLLNKTNENSN